MVPERSRRAIVNHQSSIVNHQSSMVNHQLQLRAKVILNFVMEVIVFGFFSIFAASNFELNIMIETGELYSDKFRLSCSLYEMLEIWSMRGNEVKVKYIDKLGNEQNTTAVITNIYSREGLEQMVLDEDLIVPTKDIVSINDVSFQNYLK